MTDIRNLLQEFDKLQSRKLELEAELVMLEKERRKLTEDLAAIHPKLTPENLDDNIAALDARIKRELEDLNLPEDFFNELSKLDRNI